MLFVFYANYLRLCNSVGKSPSAVAEEIGIKRSTVTRWKQGKSQTDANIQKIADYFGVPVSDLLGKEQKEKPATEPGSGLREEFVQLFSKLSPEDQEREIAYLRERVNGSNK